MINPREKLKNAILMSSNKDMAFLKILLDLTSRIENLSFKGVEKIKGDKGEPGRPGSPGESGKTPVKGKDYFTQSEIKEIKDSVRPKKKIDYFTNEDIEEIVSRIFVPEPKIPIDKIERTIDSKLKNYQDKTDLEAKIRNIVSDYILKNKLEIITEIEKKIDIKQITRGIEKLKGQDALDYYALKNRPGIKAYSEDKKVVIRGGGGVPSLTAGAGITLIAKSDGGYTISTVMSGAVLTSTGTIDDSNTAFTFISEPSLLIINGTIYSQTGGAITWTWNAGTSTATLSSPVGVNGSIFGLK